MKKITISFITVIFIINIIFVNMNYVCGLDIAPEAELNISEENMLSEDVTENETEYVKAIVTEAGDVKDIKTGSITDTVQEVTIEILEGTYKAKEFDTSYVLSYDIEGKIKAYELSVGDKVTVQLTKDNDGNIIATVQNVIRDFYIYIMFGVFLLSVILIGGKQGIKAILSLLVTILSVYFVLIKGIYNGYSAILMTIITSAIIIFLTFVITGGFSKKILTASLGTLLGVISSGLIAIIFSYLAKISGGCEDVKFLSMNITTVNFNFRDLIFAGIVISALGACMNVGMNIASSLDEIKNKSKDISWKELFISGMNIGKDVIGKMANILIFAYVGGVLTLILLFLSCNMQFSEILNKETISEEVISALAGSMGIVFTVPTTAIIYALLNRKKTVYKTISDNKIDGQRSLKI